MRPGKITTLRTQHGAVLLLMLLIMIVGGAFLFTTNFGSATKNIENDKQTFEALARAKEALLSYAAVDPNRPGEMPCPDFNNDGQSLSFGPPATLDYVSGSGLCRTAAGGIVRPGWLPWRTLRLPDLRDGNGERLWYVIFDSFRAGNTTVALNSDTPSNMTVDGGANIVAIVFSPGPPQQGQNSRGGTNAVAGLSSYLDLTNNNGDLNYASTGVGINDRLVVITRDEVMRVVERRILREAKNCLDAYAAQPTAGGKYPWAAQLDTSAAPEYLGDSGVTFGRIPIPTGVVVAPDPVMPTNWTGTCFSQAVGSFWNDWRELLFYQIAPGYQPNTAGTCGTCVTLDGNNAARAVILLSGSVLGLQARTNPNQRGTRGNYLEGANLDNDLTLTNPAVTPAINDQAICVDGNNVCR